MYISFLKNYRLYVHVCIDTKTDRRIQTPNLTYHTREKMLIKYLFKSAMTVIIFENTRILLE